MNIDSDISDVVFTGKRNAKAAEKLDYAVKRIRKEMNTKSYKWMRCVLFPEFSKGARYPGRFAMESGVYTLSTEYTIKTPDSQYFGIAVKPHANNVTDPLVFNFPECTADDWGTGSSINPYGTSEQNPLFPPELFFANSRLIACSVQVECISQESSGRIKGGIDYEVNEEFYSKDSDVKKKFATMLHAAASETTMFYAARHVLTQLEKTNDYKNADIREKYRLIGKKLADQTGRAQDTDKGINTIARYQFANDVGIIPNNLPEDDLNLFDRAMKQWRVWYNTSITALPDTNALHSALIEIITKYRLGSGWPTTAIPTEHNSPASYHGNIGKILYPFYYNATADYVSFRARSAMRSYISPSKTLDSSLMRAGSMSYMRLNMLSYKHENEFDEGIRIVYIPKRIEEIPYDTYPRDMIFIGGMQNPKEAALRIKVIRHFEGQVYSGMRQLYTVMEQPEDEEIVKTLSLLLKKFPQLLTIKPRNLEGIYKLLKAKFKWADLALREDGGGFEVVRDFTMDAEMEI